MQAVTVGIKGSTMSTRQSDWTVRSTPSFGVEMPGSAALTISLIDGTIGDVTVEGDLVLDKEQSDGNKRVLRWTSAARKTEQGDATITLTNARDNFKEVAVKVDMSEDSAVTVEVDKPKQKPYTGIELVDQYGAFAVVALGALGALIFSLLMPAHATELQSGAGAIALWGYCATDENDSYLARIVAFGLAAVAMVFAMLIPAHAIWLMGAAGSLCTAGVIWGDQDVSDVLDMFGWV